ncbi:calcium-binding protein, partial [Inquilinus sp.]|uniref:calcium-binding protein n=1 Tax=Inquilinus sp. TaxID=1932117 RepID=UPI0031D1B094
TVSNSTQVGANAQWVWWPPVAPKRVRSSISKNRPWLRHGFGRFPPAAAGLYQLAHLSGSDFSDLLGGDAGDNALYGNGGADKLWGNGGDDILDGGAGADVLDGGDGTNAASYVGSAQAVAVDLATGKGAYGDAAGDTLIRIADVFGSDFADTLVGDGADNSLYGGAGKDTLIGRGGDDFLEGGAGPDSLNGGAGDNMASYFGSSAGVTVNLATRAATGGDAQGDQLYFISGLYGSGFADQLSGDAGDNVLYGNGGADKLWGNGGNDILNGGAGADTLYGGAGYNVASYFGSLAGVSVNLATGAAAGGDAQGDLLYQITDLFGSDVADQLGGDASGNVLYGNGGADILWGNGGDDVLSGGAGADSLYGGGGRDLFLFEAAADSGATAGTRDRIMDFTRGSDRIDLSDIDANASAGGNQAFNFIGGDAFTGVAGQLRVFTEAGALVVAGDLNGDRVADFTIAVSGTASLTAGDFAL